MNNQFEKLPSELVNLILDYNGLIKYKYKQNDGIDYHKYVNIIHKNDIRYYIIKPVICKKLRIIQRAKISSIDKDSFYFKFYFNKLPRLELCYDFNWSVPGMFIINKNITFIHTEQLEQREWLIYN